MKLKRGSTVFLKVVILLIAIGVLALGLVLATVRYIDDRIRKKRTAAAKAPGAIGKPGSDTDSAAEKDLAAPHLIYEEKPVTDRAARASISE